MIDYRTECAGLGGGAGAGPAGSTPFGSAVPDGFVVLGLTVIAINRFRIFFGGDGDVGSIYEPGSILRPGSWLVTPLDPGARARLAQYVELVSDSPDPVVDVYTDGILTDERAYRLTYAPATALDGCDSVEFVSAGPDAPSDAVDRYLARDNFGDLANPQVVRDQLALGGDALGTYALDSTGDLALDSGLMGLRKRVIRRLTTQAGAFFHLLGYGLDAEIKGLLTPDRAARIASRARAQVLREPDVEQCSVAVSSLGGAPNVLSLRVAVKPRDQDEVGLDIQLSPPSDLRF